MRRACCTRCPPEAAPSSPRASRPTESTCSPATRTAPSASGRPPASVNGRVHSTPGSSARSSAHDGTLVLARGGDGKVRVWKVRRASGSVTVLPAGGCQSAAHAPPRSHATADRVLTANADGTARIWSTEPAAAAAALLHVPGGSVTAAAFSPDGKSVVLASDPGDVATVTNLTTGRPSRSAATRGRSSAREFSSDGRYVLTAGDTTARLWEAATGRTSPSSDTTASSSSTPRSAPTAGASSRRAPTRRRACGTCARRAASSILSGHRDRVYDASFSPDGKQRRHREPRRHRQDVERAHRRRRKDAASGRRRPRRHLSPGRRGHRHRRSRRRDALRSGRRPGRDPSIAAGDVDVRADGTILVTGLDGTARIGRQGQVEVAPGARLVRRRLQSRRQQDPHGRRRRRRGLERQDARA